MSEINLTAEDILGSDELDFSDAGIEPGRHVFQITSASKEQKENGVMIRLVFTPVLDDVNPFPITVTAWAVHSNPIAQRIGRETMKSLYTAVYNAPNGSFNDLEGQFVSGWMKEKDGRATVTALQPVPEEVLSETLGEAGLDL
jgi:hypothetical protein